MQYCPCKHDCKSQGRCTRSKSETIRISSYRFPFFLSSHTIIRDGAADSFTFKYKIRDLAIPVTASTNSWCIRCKTIHLLLPPSVPFPTAKDPTVLPTVHLCHPPTSLPVGIPPDTRESFSPSFSSLLGQSPPFRMFRNRYVGLLQDLESPR